ncbi:glycine cleavage system protein GcvH [Kaistia sp. K-TC2]|uniref:Glycine cleavage system H protein n=2 Tax=Kaistia nematophila TaxID=2994654 RepID=A0A9X3E798_9HYPH|nr:glycine cleavage system protein GcvH [Hyphomicrobiales bacterium]MCX5570868.1 glycine cleavage system protein GcvH [Kaistia nematophila]
MMTVYFTKDHEWIRLEGDQALVGITDYAQSQLGDVVYVELPEVGKTFAKGDDAAVVESVKAASDVYAPVSGVVVAVNAALEKSPAMINDAPESDGWFWKLTLTEPGELDGLLDEAAYKAFIDTL